MLKADFRDAHAADSAAGGFQAVLVEHLAPFSGTIDEARKNEDRLDTRLVSLIRKAALEDFQERSRIKVQGGLQVNRRERFTWKSLIRRRGDLAHNTFSIFRVVDISDRDCVDLEDLSTGAISRKIVLTGGLIEQNVDSSYLLAGRIIYDPFLEPQLSEGTLGLSRSAQSVMFSSISEDSDYVAIARYFLPSMAEWGRYGTVVASNALVIDSLCPAGGNLAAAHEACR